MTSNPLVNQSADVDRFMHTLDHPLKATIDDLRLAILDSNPQITERIKWKAPSFCIGGDDRVTFRLSPKGGLQLIFHRGAKVRDTSGFAFEDSTGLMQWAAADRAIVTFGDEDGVAAHRTALIELVNRWMDVTAG
jgi:hypothetical protein